MNSGLIITLCHSSHGSTNTNYEECLATIQWIPMLRWIRRNISLKSNKSFRSVKFGFIQSELKTAISSVEIALLFSSNWDPFSIQSSLYQSTTSFTFSAAVLEIFNKFPFQRTLFVEWNSYSSALLEKRERDGPEYISRFMSPCEIVLIMCAKATLVNRQQVHKEERAVEKFYSTCWCNEYVQRYHRHKALCGSSIIDSRMSRDILKTYGLTRNLQT